MAGLLAVALMAGLGLTGCRQVAVPSKKAAVEVRRVRTLVVTDEGSSIAVEPATARHDDTAHPTTATTEVIGDTFSIAGAWWKGLDGQWHQPEPGHPPDCTPDGSHGAVIDLGLVHPVVGPDAVTADPFVVWLKCLTAPPPPPKPTKPQQQNKPSI